jgi:hypothetical protein
MCGIPIDLHKGYHAADGGQAWHHGRGRADSVGRLFDGTFLRHLEALRADASEEQDPSAVRQLAKAAARLGDAVETLAAASAELNPTADLHGSALFRRAIVTEMMRRALAQAGID